MRRAPRLTLLTLFVFSGSVCLLSQAHAQLSGDYYKVVNNGSNPDFETGLGGIGSVAATLGPNGLPVVTPAFQGVLKDVNASGELLWWTAGGSVSFEKNQLDATPIQHTAGFFPDGETSDNNFFRTVHWQGTFDLASPGTVTLGLGADDDAFIFVDNKLFVDNGGVHGLTYVPYVTDPLTAGKHKVDLFFADRYQSQSGIDFTANIQLNPAAGVPEPGSVAMLMAGCLTGTVFLIRRRRK